MLLSANTGNKIASSFIQDTSLIGTEIANEPAPAALPAPDDAAESSLKIAEEKKTEPPKDESIKSRLLRYWGTTKEAAVDITSSV